MNTQSHEFKESMTFREQNLKRGCILAHICKVLKKIPHANERKKLGVL